MKKTNLKKLTKDVIVKIEKALQQEPDGELSYDVLDVYAIPAKYLRKWKDQIDWRCASVFQNFTREEMVEFADLIDWSYFFCHRDNLYKNTDFFNQHKDIIPINAFMNWYHRSTVKEIDWNFIREHKDEINEREWVELSKRADLTDKLAEEFADKVHWYWVTYYCKRSAEFIAKHADRDLAWFEIANSKNYSKKFKETVNEECRRQIGMKDVCWD